MKMSRFKFDQNRIKDGNFHFSKVSRVEEGDLHLKILLSIIIGKHMKMFLFIFNLNRTKNHFFEGKEGGKKGAPNSKFYYNV